jgi:hypothetical protein
MESSKKEYLVKSKLLERGWTNSLINKFLPEPDEIKKNPHYRKAAPMKLYLLEKIQQKQLMILKFK